MKNLLLLITALLLMSCENEIEAVKPFIDYDVELCKEWKFIEIESNELGYDMYVTFNSDGTYIISAQIIDRMSYSYGTWTWCEYGKKITFSLQNIVDCNGDVIEDMIFENGLLIGNSYEHGVKRKIVLKVIE